MVLSSQSADQQPLYVGDVVDVITGSYKGSTGVVEGFSATYISVYIKIDGLNGDAKCLQVKSVQIARDSTSPLENMPRRGNENDEPPGDEPPGDENEPPQRVLKCVGLKVDGDRAPSKNVTEQLLDVGDLVVVKAGSYKGKSGVVEGFSTTNKSVYVKLDGIFWAKCVRVTSVQVARNDQNADDSAPCGTRPTYFPSDGIPSVTSSQTVYRL